VTQHLSALIVYGTSGLPCTIRELFSRMGFAARNADGVAAAKDAIAGARNPFDVIFTDLSPCGGSGLEVVKASNRRSPETLVTVLTDPDSLQTAIEALRMGAYDYLIKPLNAVEIGLHLQGVIRRVALLKENARLSHRIQELYAELRRFQSERQDIAKRQEEIRRELLEANRRLAAGQPADSPF
jgi:DNA-binding NtrC family response regulator